MNFNNRTAFSEDFDGEQDVYKYESPVQKEIKESKLLLEIKAAEIRATKLKVQKLEEDYILPFIDDDTVGSRCGICHVKGHQKPTCQNPPCVTVKQCGHLKGHSEERKAFEAEKAELKKLQKEAKVLEEKIEKQELAERAVLSSFPQAVRLTLINSNKSKYLIATPSGYVPRNSIIHRDISVLQKAYKNQVPDDLSTMGPIFRMILEEHDAKYNVRKHRDPVLTTLKNKGVFPTDEGSHAKSPNRKSQEDKDLEYALRKSLFDQNMNDVFAEVSKDITPEKQSRFRPHVCDRSPLNEIRTPTKSPLHKRHKDICKQSDVNNLQEVFSKMTSPSKARIRSYDSYTRTALPTNTNTARALQSETYTPRGPDSETYTPRALSDSYTPRALQSETYSPRALSSDSYTPRPLPSKTYTPRALSSDSYTPSQASETYPRKSPVVETYTAESLPAATYTPRSLTADTYTPRSLPAATYTPRSLPSDTYTPRSLPSDTYTPRSLPADTYTPRSLPADTYTPRTLPSDVYPSRSLPSDAYTLRSLHAETYTPRALPTENYTPRALRAETHIPRVRLTESYPDRALSFAEAYPFSYTSSLYPFTYQFTSQARYQNADTCQQGPEALDLSPGSPLSLSSFAPSLPAPQTSQAPRRGSLFKPYE